MIYFKQILCILIASVTLITSSRGIVIWLEYKINQKYILKNLCVEKDKPKNTCQGKCHLKAHLNESDKEKDSSANKLPSLRIKFDENISGLFDKDGKINIRNQRYQKQIFLDNDKISKEKKEPPSPPPKV